MPLFAAVATAFATVAGGATGCYLRALAEIVSQMPDKAALKVAIEIPDLGKNGNISLFHTARFLKFKSELS